MQDKSKRTSLQLLADYIRRWQLKGISNEEIVRMIRTHRGFGFREDDQRSVRPVKRQNGRGDWVM